MIYRPQLLTALENLREDFVGFEREWREEVREGARLLRELGERTSAEISNSLPTGAAPGAMPSEELEQHGSMAVTFGERWRSHEEARRWAREILFERVTFAADGSQILPGREISLPVAGVQVGSFENPHTLDGRGYVKDSHFEVITPRELLESDGGAANAGALVNLRRFQLEAKTVAQFLEKKRGWRERGERMPIAFFDNMLLLLVSVSPSKEAVSETQFPNAYVYESARLVRLSREARVPLVGYIDQSYARDLVRLLGVLNKNRWRSSMNVYDAQLLRAKAGDKDSPPPLLAGWGDRTIFCHCVREGLPDEFLDERGTPLVGFVYLQTTSDASPARLDVPTWVYEDKLLGEVVDAVRAECVVGNGYPYALETADQTAVITWQDRERFLHTMQDFAEGAGFPFSVSRKSVSKVRRR